MALRDRFLALRNRFWPCKIIFWLGEIIFGLARSIFGLARSFLAFLSIGLAKMKTQFRCKSPRLVTYLLTVSTNFKINQYGVASVWLPKHIFKLFKWQLNCQSTYPHNSMMTLYTKFPSAQRCMTNLGKVHIF